MIGGLLVKAAFLACLGSVVSYYLNHRKPGHRSLIVARSLFIATVVLVVGIAAYFLSLILSHQFQYTYIWSYSAVDLPTPLLISTFYAGQEGSFLLWTLFTCVIGLFLVRHSSRMGYEPEVMAAFGTIASALLLMLIVKNPFTYVWESFPDQVKAGFLPANGRGLNPLLQNYWMVIHPQVLFSGFASMGVPYAYAVAALLKRDFTNWFRAATPWLVFAGLILGTGIMMGGFWAYETLGWGGYWGWDPVENSSLVPWLVAIAAIHTTLSQRRSGAFVRTNLVLGMLCFLMVVYSTFLTRSGVLGDTSVHSFVDPGMLVYWLLVGMIVLFTGIGAGLLIRRWKEIPKAPPRHDYYSREFALFLGSATLVTTALLVTAGTSSPLITDLLYGKKSAVDISYYATTTLPLGVLIGVLTGIGQLLWWTRSDRGEFYRSLVTPVALSAVVTAALAIIIGVRPLIGLFLFAAGFALFANIQVGWKIVKGNPKYAGGAVAHLGLAVMFFGFVASSAYDEKETISLTQGQPVEAMGYRLTYTGYGPLDKEKYAFHVQVEHDGKRFAVAPVMYYSSYNDGLMRNPDIINLVTKDFYLAPMSLEQANDGTAGLQKIEMRKGSSATVGDVRITFLDFDFPADQRAAMMEGKEVHIGAKIEVRREGDKPLIVVPVKTIRQGETSDKPATYMDRYEFTISSMRPDREAQENMVVELGVRDLAASREAAGKPDVLIAEASIKPFINLVWSGVIILLVGFLITIVRRSQEAAGRVVEE